MNQSNKSPPSRHAHRLRDTAAQRRAFVPFPVLTIVLPLLLSSCASLQTAPSKADVRAPLPAAWLAPLPHGGQLSNLSRWWQQFNDPVLNELITAAQTVSPSVAQAASRIEQSRATQVAAEGALLPTLGAGAAVSRSRQDLNAPILGLGTAGLQTRWELDVFGGQRAAGRAAEQRLAGAQASWHDARVSVAAEVANRYIALRACVAQLGTAQADARSRAETARLTELSAKAGFQAPASAALARASSAQGSVQLIAQQARCELEIKSLVALSGIDEPGLRQRLERQRMELGEAQWASVPRPAQIAVTQVPAQVLAQRPDVLAAEREWQARRADVTQAQAQLLPQISLSGSVSAARAFSGAFSSASSSASSSGFSRDGTVWSLGPLAVTLPLFDGGARRANVSASEARLDEAGVLYRATLRTAVREVEEALINLQSGSEREADAQRAAEGYRDSLRASEARFRAGLGSLFELEDARRTAVQAQSALIDLQRERSLAWVSLYRALGGGWTPTTDQAASELPTQAVPVNQPSR